MQDTDANRDIERQMAMLFAAAETPPEADEQFVAGVLGQIRRRQRLRWMVLGGSALAASVFALFTLPALWELLASWNGASLNVVEILNDRLNQAAVLATGFLGAAIRSVTTLTAVALAITILPLLRWLAD